MKEIQIISLSEIMATKSGSVDPSKFTDEIFDLYSIPAYDSRKPEVVTGKLIGSTKQIVKPGDVLLSKIVPHIRRSWVVGETQGRRIIASGEWIVFQSEKIYPGYLRHVLVSDTFHSKLMSTVSGVGGSLLRARPEFVAKIKISLPSLSEQQRIADILDRAEALRAKRRAALAQLDELTQSIFTEMFGDPLENPRNWNVEKVQDVISQIEAGWSANGEHKHRKENEYAVLKVSAVTQGVFLPEEYKVINNDIEFKKVVTPEKGDVLFSRANTLELVGASCFIKENYPYLLLPDKLWKIKVNEEKICPEYFKFILSYPTIRYEISKRSTGTSGSMYNISMDKFRRIKITVPPIEIQKKFSIIVGTIEKTKELQEKSLLEINNLFNALMHEAFTGKLFSHQSFERQMGNGGYL